MGLLAGANCRRELNAALERQKPLILVREADEGKGGASMDALEAECRVHSRRPAGTTVASAGDGASLPALRHPCSPAALERLFSDEARAAEVTWARQRDFQLVSLRLIGTELVHLSPHYFPQPELLDGGLVNPSESLRARFAKPARLIYSGANAGARELAVEMRRAALDEQPELSYEVSQPGAADAPPSACLLYLNRRTFDFDVNDKRRPGASTAATVRQALKQRVKVVCAHEQGLAGGAVPFSRFFDHTPEDLINAGAYSQSPDPAPALLVRRLTVRISLQVSTTRSRCRCTLAPSTAPCRSC